MYGHPIFNFECTECHQEFERSMTVEETNSGHQALCPDCGGLSEKLFNAGIPVKHVSWSQWKVDLNQD